MTAPESAVNETHRRATSGGGHLVVRSRGLSGRVEARSVVVTAVAGAVAFAVFVWSLTVGDFPVPVAAALDSVFGGGSHDADFIVRTVRMPRAVIALAVGAAFGLSGAIFQRLARNPLASPDVIGINAGGAAAAAFVIVVMDGTPKTVTVGALAGSTLTALVIYVLAYRRGVTGYRLVLVGIGVTAMLGSTTSYLLTQADIRDAQRAAVWLTGSLNFRTWDDARPMLVVLVLIPIAVVLARQLRVLELGDEAAAGLGVNVNRARGSLLFVGVALAAVSTASAGPVAFVALVAPQIARRLTHERSVSLLPAAACGALLLVTADLVARRAFAPTELPVGIFTAVLGAPYLLYLLVRANRIGAGG